MKLRCIRGDWRTASGPLRSFAWVGFVRSGRGGKGTPRQATKLRLGGLRCAPTPLRCAVSWPRRGTHFAHCVRYVQTAATSQLTLRAAREATSPVLLGASEALRALSGRAFAGRLVFHSTRREARSARQAVPGGGDFCGGEERRSSVGARSALRNLTLRSCLSVESEANAASSATRLKAEHHSGVGAKRRPPRHESPAGTACRATLKPRGSGRSRTAATGRQQQPESTRVRKGP